MRPWGELEWLLTRINTYTFDFLGCLSTEDRCLGALKILSNNKCVNQNGLFLEIIDPGNPPEHAEYRGQLRTDLLEIQNSLTIKAYDLLCSIGQIKMVVDDFIISTDGHIVLDITSFPKRFFFPIVKLLLKSPKVKTLLFTYSVPENYTSSELSDSPMEWAHIPMFDTDDPDIKIDIALVGLGFMHLGLSSLLKDKYSEVSIQLLFPFPPGAPSYQRTWNFIEEMNSIPKLDYRQMKRIDALSVSEIFDTICSITNGGRTTALMAPYGPKPMSLAMCLYACITNMPVYYTQPTSYDSKYSVGIKKTYGYVVKLGGKILYEL